MRLLGVAVGDLEAQTQPDLFGAGAAQESRIDAAVDDVRRRFGSARLVRASQIRRTSD